MSVDYFLLQGVYYNVKQYIRMSNWDVEAGVKCESVCARCFSTGQRQEEEMMIGWESSTIIEYDETQRD